MMQNTTQTSGMSHAKNAGTNSPATAGLSYDQRLERFERRQTRIRVSIACVLFGCAGFLFWRNATMVTPLPPPNSSGYYVGPWVNKNGDLVSSDGKVLTRGYRPSMGGTVSRQPGFRPATSSAPSAPSLKL